MSSPPDVAILFCEDIREEVGGKVSYMGVLAPEAWVTSGDKEPIYCVLLVWASEPEVVIAGEFALENAPDGVVAPSPFTRTFTKNKGDEADRWLIQLHGRMDARVGEKPLVITARFTVAGQVHSNRLLLELEPKGQSATDRARP